MMLFAIIWISACTGALLIIPKCIALFSPTSQLNQVDLSGAKSSVGGFSFISIASFDQPSLLQQYQAALTSQLALVTQRLAQLMSSSVPTGRGELHPHPSKNRLIEPKPTRTSSTGSTSMITTSSMTLTTPEN